MPRHPIAAVVLASAFALAVLAAAGGVAAERWVAGQGQALAPAGFAAVPESGYALRVAAAGGYAYVAAGRAGLRVFDVTDPARPVEVGSLPATPGREPLVVALDGGRAYLARDALMVVDVADPARPAELGALAGFLGARAVAAAGAYAYVVTTTSGPGSLGQGLHVVDVSDPARPAAVGLFADPYASAVAVVGRYAYLLAGDPARLAVVDVGDPARPTEVGAYTPPDPSVGGVAVEGRYAYLTVGGALRVVDVSDPTHPAEVGASVPLPCGGVFGPPAAAGRYVFVEHGAAYPVFRGAIVYRNGVSVFDVGDPAHPRHVGFHDFCYPGGPSCSTLVNDLAAVGATAYAVGRDNGLTVLRFTPPGLQPPPPPQGFRTILPIVGQRC